MLENSIFAGLEEFSETTKNRSKNTTTKKRSTRKKWAGANENERQANLMAEKRASDQDIGNIPDVVNQSRKQSCSTNFKLFCETYNPEAFYYGWSDDHLKYIKKVEQCVLLGALFAIAMPRGSGKSTIAKMAVLWACLYAHRLYVFVIASTGPKAKEFMADVKTLLKMPMILEDFPEVAYPIKMMGNSVGKCKSQKSNGKLTNMMWTKDEVSFPTIEGADTSGIRIVCAGITSEGIRGSARTMENGEVRRPDLVIPDDPQTDESARSSDQNANRTKVLNGAVLEMAGPGKTMAGVMPCTVIQKGDMVDCALDHEISPDWRGQKTKFLKTLPDNEDLWNEYSKIYKKCLLKDPPDHTECNEFYLSNREEMDRGAEASWKERFKQHEISAIQSGMNLKLLKPDIFFAEYQNEPQSDGDADYRLNIDVVMKALNGLKKGEVQEGYNVETIAIDLNHHGLSWAYCSFKNTMTTNVCDYGVYAGYHEDGKGNKIHDKAVWWKECGKTEEQAFTDKLSQFIKIIHEKYPRAKIGVDGNKWTDTVHQVVQRFDRLGYKIYVLRGYSYKKYAPLKANDKRLIGENRDNCHYETGAKGKSDKQVTFNSDYWHKQTQQGFRIMSPGDASVSSWGDNPIEHEVFAGHCTRDRLLAHFEKDGREYYDWGKAPGNNDLFDAVSMCQVLASMSGCGFVEDSQYKKHKNKKRRSRKVVKKYH